MNRLTANLLFWWVALIVAWGYAILFDPLEVSNYFLGMMIIVAIIELLSNLRYLEKEYLEDDGEKIVGKENL